MVAVRVAVVAVAGGVALASCSSSGGESGPTSYRAEATLLVVAHGGNGSSSAAKTVANLATSPQALRKVQIDLGLSLSIAQLSAKISATAVDARDVDIVVDDTESQRAAEIANSDVNALRTVAPAVVAGAHITVVHPATAGTASN